MAQNFADNDADVLAELEGYDESLSVLKRYIYSEGAWEINLYSAIDFLCLLTKKGFPNT